MPLPYRQSPAQPLCPGGCYHLLLQEGCYLHPWLSHCSPMCVSITLWAGPLLTVPPCVGLFPGSVFPTSLWAPWGRALGLQYPWFLKYQWGLREWKRVLHISYYTFSIQIMVRSLKEAVTQLCALLRHCRYIYIYFAVWIWLSVTIYLHHEILVFKG